LGIAAPVVLGFAMQLLGSVSGLDLTRKLLLTTPFEAWHGLFAQHPFTGPLTTGLAESEQGGGERRDPLYRQRRIRGSARNGGSTGCRRAMTVRGSHDGVRR
jgi:hypothetical protein